METGRRMKAAVVKETSPGVYWGQADWLTKPGSVDMVFTVKAGDHDDLLGEGNARKAMFQLRGGVACDDGYGQGHGREGRDGKPV